MGDIPRRTFGKTGEKLTVIGQAGGRFPLISEEDAKAIVLRAYELGINYFDNAYSYWDGHSEEVYGMVLPPFRKEVFITTKSTQRSRKEAAAELDLSLKRLRTDYVDLWQIHAVGEMEEVRQIFGPGGAVEAFEAAKKAGKCRFIGFTGHRDPEVHLAMLEAYDNYDSILMPLHIADPGYLSFEKRVLPVAVEPWHGHPGDEEFRQRQAAAVVQHHRLPELCAEPADSLHGHRLHNHGPTGRRRAHRPAVQALFRGADGGTAGARRENFRSPPGGLEAKYESYDGDGCPARVC